MVNIANGSICHRDIVCPCNLSWISSDMELLFIVRFLELHIFQNTGIMVRDPVVVSVVVPDNIYQV